MNVAEGLTITGQSPANQSGRQLRVRLGENLFRRWPLFIVPALLLLGLGVYRAKDLPKKYESVGTINVASTTAISQINSINSPSFGYETPSSKTARDINQRLGSQAFAESVADGAGLKTIIASGGLTLNQMRSYLSASSSGDNVLRISATTDYPDLSEKLASSLITTYVAYVLDVETSQYTAAATFIQGNLTTYQTAAAAAQKKLDDYIAQHPSPAIGGRPDDQALTIQRLSSALDTAQKQVVDTQSKLDTANLAVKQSQVDITQRLQVIDQPKLPSSPQPIMKKRVLLVGIFLIIGLLVAGGALLVVAVLDRTVRTSADLDGVPGDLHLIGTVPKLHTARRSGHRIVPELSAEVKGS
ncbi:MAG: hypothetical protein ABIQ39_06605 [Ilumatobacteraceae bacterium]